MSARLGITGAGLVLAGAVMIGAGAVAGSGLDGFGPAAMMGGNGFNGSSGVNRTTTSPYGYGVMGGNGGYGVMGRGGVAGTSAPGPGEPGFVAGTQASPRLLQVVAGPGLSFTPSAITVQRGETVTFEVTAMGPYVHEFMVGPAAAVAADQDGTPEAADIGMMQTKAVTYTFDGTGPYAFACHAPGHYEAGMRGTITVVG